MEYDVGEVLETAMEAGHILLESGAEIFRVEDTMKHISRHFGVEATEENFFVLSNGIFTTGHKNGREFAKIQHIPVHGARLSKVVAINQLSREIEQGKYTLDEVRERLKEIRALPEKPKPLQILASGLGAAAFSYMLGGSLTDAGAALLAGLLLHVFVLFVSLPHMSKIIGNICGGALVTVVCALCHGLGFGDSLSHMIIGSIIPLVPGVAFTNGIRDIADGDYISGAVRLLDAVLVFLCIAIGVGLVFTVYRRISGGALL